MLENITIKSTGVTIYNDKFFLSFSIVCPDEMSYEDYLNQLGVPVNWSGIELRVYFDNNFKNPRAYLFGDLDGSPYREDCQFGIHIRDVEINANDIDIIKRAMLNNVNRQFNAIEAMPAVIGIRSHGDVFAF